MPIRTLVLSLLLALGTLHAEPPPPSASTTPLFDGSTLKGWEGDTKMWRVEEGAITGGSRTEKIAHNDFLATTAEYGNFVLRLKIKLTGDSKSGMLNSGIQIRSQRVPDSHEMRGYQCDWGDPTWWGSIYDESRRNRVLAQSDMKALEPVLRREDWSDYVIRADGPRITTWINGVQAVDYTESDPAVPLTGRIGVQIHSGGKALVQVKEITIEVLPATPASAAFYGAPPPLKTAKASPLTGAEQRATFTLPPGFEIELVAEEEPGVTGKFVSVAFDQQGRMWSMTAFDYPVDGNENPAMANALYAQPGKDKVLVWDTPFAVGPQKPRVFADGLAIPLGILPHGDGCFVQHGPEIVHLRDTDRDGRADRRDVALSGFGVQDSHLFPHQFMRAPGNWIWFAQGAFNSGRVKTASGDEAQFDATRMARFRTDGSEFEITSQGPCNIWGLVLNGEGEAWIQEANDYGYPATPFHEFANYPGCSDRLFKSYAPQFPGSAPDFKMGGTGLSGLALSDAKGAWPSAYADVMYVANPITREIQALRIHRDGPHYRLQKLPDFIRSSDEMFRPVAIQFGPDGCLYIVDWYNKIISHNEVPRNHPERDKTRGRIWRVRHTAQTPFVVPDFTRLSGDELLARLGGESLAQSHLAWQAIGDRGMVELAPKLKALIADAGQSASRRIASLWALEALRSVKQPVLVPLLKDINRNVRREAIRAWGEAKLPALVDAVTPLAGDVDPEVRAQILRSVGALLGRPYGVGFAKHDKADPAAISLIVRMGYAELSAPLAPSTRDGKPQAVREAYDRAFERYLVRLFLETQPAALADWLDSPAAAALPVENRLLASLALEPRTSARRVAQLLPQLGRAPGEEELLRIASFTGEPGVSDALQMAIHTPAVLEALLAVRTKLESTKLSPLLATAAARLFAGTDTEQALALRLITGFQLTALEPQLVAALEQSPARATALLRALGEIGSTQTDLFVKLAKTSADARVRDEALNTLAVSKSNNAPSLLLELWPTLSATQRRHSLDRLAATKHGALAVVGALRGRRIFRDDLEGATLDKLQAVLPDSADLAALSEELGGLFRPVLALDGSDTAGAETPLMLTGPLTVEAWVRLAPGIGNEDGIFCAPGQLDLNFYDGKFRAHAGAAGDVAIARKPIQPDTWTHVAATRDEAGVWRLYQDGELDATGTKSAGHTIENPVVGFTGAPGGSKGAISELRVWNKARTAEEIRANFDRSLAGEKDAQGLVFQSAGAANWGKLRKGATVIKTSDFPPLLTSAEADALDQRFNRFRALAEVPGDPTRGQQVAALCQACHLMGASGINLGPNLSGVGAMGTEAILRNILTPNAAMEAGYRIYRVELLSGEIVDAFFVSEDETGVVVRAPGIQDRRISKAEIRGTKYLRRSLMPEGLLDGLPPTQVSDLFAYLKSLK